MCGATRRKLDSSNSKALPQRCLWVVPLCGLCKLHFLWVEELRGLAPAEALPSRGKDPDLLSHQTGTSPEDKRPVDTVCCMFCLTEALI